MHAAPGAPLTLGCWLAVEASAGSAHTIDMQMILMPQGEAFDACDETERRLRAACGGLLAVDHPPRVHRSGEARCRFRDNHSYHRTTFGSRVQYLHRTVRDWFEEVEVWAEITSLTADTTFDANLSMLRAWILRLKVLPTEGGSDNGCSVCSAGHIWDLVEEAATFADKVNIEADEASADRLALRKAFRKTVNTLWAEQSDRCLWVDRRRLIGKLLTKYDLPFEAEEAPQMLKPESPKTPKLPKRPLSARITKRLRLSWK